MDHSSQPKFHVPNSQSQPPPPQAHRRLQKSTGAAESPRRPQRGRHNIRLQVVVIRRKGPHHSIRQSNKIGSKGMKRPPQCRQTSRVLISWRFRCPNARPRRHSETMMKVVASVTMPARQTGRSHRSTPLRKPGGSTRPRDAETKSRD